LCPIGSGDKEQLMSTTAVRPALANPLAAFGEYLARTRGVCPGTRHNYITYAGAFLEAVTAGAAGAAGEIGPREVAEFVRDLTGRYEAGTVCPGRLGASFVLQVLADGRPVRRRSG
jgi:hypothetical protein